MKKQISRRTFIKGSVAGLTAAAMYGFGVGPGNLYAQVPETTENGNILTAYFSHTGNTRYMAKQVHARVGGDLLEIKTVTPYLGDDREVHRIAREEKQRGFRPELATPIPDMARYDTILIGYPCWWFTMPMAVFAFLEQAELSGKTVVPFTTHAVSGWGEGLADLRATLPRQAILAKGLALQGRRVREAGSERNIASWLGELGLVK